MSPALMPTRHSGFSLTEILVVLLVIAILVAIALPGYREHVMKNKRKDAIDALGRIQIEQEKRRGSASAYGTLADLGLPAVSADGHYTLSIANLTATTYTAIATATGPQAEDKACATLEATQAGPDIGNDQKKACWAQ